MAEIRSGWKFTQSRDGTTLFMAELLSENATQRGSRLLMSGIAAARKARRAVWMILRLEPGIEFAPEVSFTLLI
jgi:hypothetical protein